MATDRYGIDYSILPEHMRDGMALYIERGIRPGSFATAVLANDLMETFQRADQINAKRIHDYVFWLYNEAPAECHGSYDAVNRWCADGGLDRVGFPADPPQIDAEAPLSDRARQAVEYESDALAAWHSTEPGHTADIADRRVSSYDYSGPERRMAQLRALAAEPVEA